MKKQSAELLFDKLSKDCENYLVAEAESNRVSLSESLKTSFVLELKFFVSDADNMTSLVESKTVTDHVEDVALDKLWEFYLTLDEGNFDTVKGVGELLESFCRHLLF